MNTDCFPLCRFVLVLQIVVVGEYYLASTGPWIVRAEHDGYFLAPHALQDQQHTSGCVAVLDELKWTLIQGSMIIFPSLGRRE